MIATWMRQFQRASAEIVRSLMPVAILRRSSAAITSRLNHKPPE